MSSNNQRVKMKTMQRPRTQRINTNYSKAPVDNNFHLGDDPGIFSNFELTYVLCRYVIGNIGELTTTSNDTMLGIVEAMSPSGDMGLGFAYTPKRDRNVPPNNKWSSVSLANWKMLRIPNIKHSDCLLVDSKTDPGSVNESDTGSSEGKVLIPFFESSDAVNDCFLDRGGFPADEMFKTNEELFSVETSYDPDLSEYTTQVDRKAPNFLETEARCAQLARDIERSESVGVGSEEMFEDEEAAFSAVLRPVKEPDQYPERKTITEHGPSRPVAVPEVSHQLASISIRTDEVTSSDFSEAKESAVAIVSVSEVMVPIPSVERPTNDCQINGTLPPDATDKPVVVSSDATGVLTTLPSPASADSKPKKSTLDPNAPEFQPLSMQYVYPLAAAQSLPPVQPAVQHLVFSTQVIHPGPNANATGSLTVPTLATFIPQSQLCGPSGLPFGSQTGPIPHILPGTLPASVASNIAQQMRGVSLPPSLHQSKMSNFNSSPGILIPHAQSGMSCTQLVSTQPPVLSGRYSGSSTVNLSRQQSNEPPSSTSNFGSSHTNVPVSTITPPVYQFSQAGGGFPLWLPGAPQMGLHFGAANPSALMAGNIPLQQASTQQIYPAHAMLHLQPQLPVQTVQLEPAPSSAAPQPAQHPPVFQGHPTHFQEHPIPIPQYATNMMFTVQQPTQGYYPSASVFAGPAALNQHIRGGLHPVLNASAPQHPVAANLGHQQSPLDSSVIHAQVPTQFSQSNCQPPHLQNYNFAQQLIQSTHLNPQQLQPDAYQNIAAFVAAARNPLPQAH